MNLHAVTALLLVVLLALAPACAKKAPPKPIHTEPWLAHPPASAAASADASLPLLRYVLGAQSQVRFEVPSKHGTLRGSFSRVSGEFSIDPSDLARSLGRVQVDLSSIAVSADGSADDAALVTRVKNALSIVDGGSTPKASFELSSLEDASPAQLEPRAATDGGGAGVRRARATALGNLLLHGFRVQRRAALAAEFNFAADPQTPSSILIRSRAPFVVSLESHEIYVAEAESSRKPEKGARARAREARITVELYGTKAD